MKQSKMDLFISLAKPGENGHSRWVSVSEFIGDYQALALGNGGSWCRASSNLAKTYKIEFDKSLTKGNSIDRIMSKATNKRWSAKNILGNPYDFYKGDENYTDELGCVGCYQYDPVTYRKECVKKITQEVTQNIMQKLYGENE